MPAPDNHSPTVSAVARMPLASWHARHGARFDEMNLWQVPVVYSTEDQEGQAARNSLAIADVSFTAKLMLRGLGISELIPPLTGEGRATKNGGVASLTADKSVFACRLHGDQLLVLAGPSGQAKLDRLITTAGKGLTFLPTDATSTYAALWLFGPHLNELLRQLTRYDVAALGPCTCAQTGLAGVPAILVRPPTPAISNLRILIGWDVAEYIWEKIWEAGQSKKIAALGMDALDLLLSQASK